MQLDVLAFGAHPDDVELSCSGTLIKLVEAGKKVGIVDLTQGEMGTRGSAQLRLEEAQRAADIMGLSARENLNLGDAQFEVNQENKLKVIQVIRKYRPTMIFMNAIDDRHIDHPRGAELVKQAAFLSGLAKIVTKDQNGEQERWRPKHTYHYIQYRYIQPQFVVDISAQYEKKMQAILAYSSQFYDPKSNEPSTLISSDRFMRYIEGRAREFGSAIMKEYGEGFTSDTPLAIEPIHWL